MRFSLISCKAHLVNYAVPDIDDDLACASSLIFDESDHFKLFFCFSSSRLVHQDIFFWPLPPFFFFSNLNSFVITKSSNFYLLATCPGNLFTFSLIIVFSFRSEKKIFLGPFRLFFYLSRVFGYILLQKHISVASSCFINF